jgi:hypothetical protein
LPRPRSTTTNCRFLSNWATWLSPSPHAHSRTSPWRGATSRHSR